MATEQLQLALPGSEPPTDPRYDHLWRWGRPHKGAASYSPPLKGRRCRVLCRGRGKGPLNVAVEFPGGEVVVAPRFAVRPLAKPVAAPGGAEAPRRSRGRAEAPKRVLGPPAAEQSGKGEVGSGEHRIMVDELSRPIRSRHRAFAAGSCHLMTDGPIEILHAFAHRLGLQREWFQDHPLHPHYDLTASKRRQALKLGAVFVPAREQARQRLPKKITKAHSVAGDSGEAATYGEPVQQIAGLGGLPAGPLQAALLQAALLRQLDAGQYVSERQLLEASQLDAGCKARREQHSTGPPRLSRPAPLPGPTPEELERARRETARAFWEWYDRRNR